MFCAIEDEDLAADGLSGEKVRVLRHVPGAVDLAVVVDTLNYLYARRRGQGVAAELAALVIVGGTVELLGGGPGAVWKLYLGDLKVVLALARGVGAEQKTVGGVRLVGVSGLEM